MAELFDVCKSLNLTLECGEPTGHVVDNWPSIRYECTLLRNGKEVWSGPYSLGVGHVNPNNINLWKTALTIDEEHLLYTWQKKPHANFKDKQLHAQVAAKVAKLQKVQPKLSDVVCSLMLDGYSYFNALDFDEWCDEYGYDTDSRKALDIFEACQETGRLLTRAFSRDELSALEQAAQEH